MQRSRRFAIHATFASMALLAPFGTAQEPAPPAPVLTEEVMAVARDLGIADKLSMAPVRGAEAGAEVRFLQKTGFEFADLMKLLGAIEMRDPRIRIASMNFGQRDQETSIWRPLTMSVRADRGVGGRLPSALARLDQFLAVIGEINREASGVTINRLEVAWNRIAWSMSAAEPMAFTKLRPLLLRLPEVREVEPGKLSTPGGMARYEGCLITFGVPDPPAATPGAAGDLPALAHVRDAVKRVDPAGTAIDVRSLSVRENSVGVSMACTDPAVLGRLIEELRNGGHADGLLIEELKPEPGRWHVTGRVEWRR